MRLAFLFMLLLCLAAPAQDESVQWRTITEGHGRQVQLGDRVTISYVLRLESGELIQATPENVPFAFTVGSTAVVPGISQGVLGMKRGETRHVRIPPSLAYGSKGIGNIPPDAVLLFAIELEVIEDENSGQKSLSLKFGKDGDGNRPDARNLDKPAMFEYLIRDFFTKPWRYADSPGLTWQASAVLAMLTALLWLLGRWLHWRDGGPE